jgi:hypothetical protein
MKIKGVFGTEFQISSKTLAIVFAATGALLAALSAKAIPVPMGIPDIAADYAQSWANFLLKLWAPIGPTILVLFSDSTPGPLAPPDPDVVQVATEKAKDMGQIAKAFLLVTLSVGALSMAFPGHASAKTGRVTCTPGVLGCPRVAPPAVSDVTPAPATTAPTTQPNLIQGVLEALLEVQAQFVADVNAANAEANVMWPPTPTGGTPPAGQGPIDPIAGACYPTLASWASSLALPAAPANGTGTGPVAVFEDLRVANIAAHNLVQQIGSSGFPPQLVVACGGLVTDTVTQAGVDAGQVASFATMLATFIPKPILMKHNVGFLADFQKPRSH